MTLEGAVRTALDALNLGPSDQGTAELALCYARAVDAEGGLDKLGPQLLAVLESLGMSPRARASITKGATNGSPSASPLDELRARRAARQRDPEAVDAAAS